MKAQCEGLVNDPTWIERLEAEHFDVGISEIWHLCPFALFHRIGIRTHVAALATHNFQNAARLWGIPTFSSFVTKLIHRAFGADFPGLREIARNISLLLLNTNPFFEMPRPSSNKIVYIGGLIEMKPKPLNTELTALLNSSTDGGNEGVVLVSFGSLANARKMGLGLKLSMLRVFAKFPRHKFIWKLEMDEGGEDAKLFAKEAPNVHPVKWVDQKALLLHPNLRAFITHCGLNSVTEAARAGVPIIGLPLFADQLYNSMVAEFRGIGVQLDGGKLNREGGEQLLIEALEKILHNPFYRQNAKLVSKKLALTPFSAEERLVKWVEFAAEFPELNELNLPGEKEMGIFAYYSLDVIFALILALAMALMGIGLGTRIICRKIIGQLIWFRTKMSMAIIDKNKKMKSH